MPFLLYSGMSYESTCLIKKIYLDTLLSCSQPIYLQFNKWNSYRKLSFSNLTHLNYVLKVVFHSPSNFIFISQIPWGAYSCYKAFVVLFNSSQSFYCFFFGWTDKRSTSTSPKIIKLNFFIFSKQMFAAENKS